MLFCVLFVCKCVLYCCHWVATQLQLKNISIAYHIMSYHISYLNIISSYIVISYIMPYTLYIMSYHIIYRVISYHIIYIMSSYIMSYIISCHIYYISCHISCHIIYHVISYHTHSFMFSLKMAETCRCKFLTKKINKLVLDSISSLYLIINSVFFISVIHSYTYILLLCFSRVATAQLRHRPSHC